MPLSPRGAPGSSRRRARRHRVTWNNDRMDIVAAGMLMLALFALLGAGVWIGLALMGVAWIGMLALTTRGPGDAMAVTVWGTASSWTLTALPLFVWMGEILFRTPLSEDMFPGLAPWMER